MLSRTPAPRVDPPALPDARGPLSAAVLAVLRGEPPAPAAADPYAADAHGADPYGDDLQLALYCCYELHYRGFAGVPDECEWWPGVLAVRRELERVFEGALRADTVPADGTPEEAARELEGLLAEPVEGHGPSWHLRRDGEVWQLREYVAHRSLYHLKEADPQAWVIPRLAGPAKAALVAVEHDEYGAGDPDRMHARLFADMMAALGLSPDYGHYLPAAPAATLAEVNFMPLCGLHRRLRGALVGQFAAVELTSSPGSDRLVRGMRRLGCREAAIAFYDEHVEADAVHEQVVRHGVVAPLLAAEPELAGDVVFGVRGSALLGERFGAAVLDAWAAGRPSLRVPLPDAPRAGAVPVGAPG